MDSFLSTPRMDTLSKTKSNEPIKVQVEKSQEKKAKATPRSLSKQSKA